MSDDTNRPGDANAAEPEAKLTTETLERRAMLRRFGTYAAFTAPALTVLMASRQSEAGGFSRNSAHNTGGNSFGGGGGGAGGGGGGGCGFSC